MPLYALVAYMLEADEGPDDLGSAAHVFDNFHLTRALRRTIVEQHP